MTQVNVYNKEGQQVKTLDLIEAVFNTPSNNSLVHQVYIAQRANARLPWADTKDKGEVRGGGKKPWKQKGTGRARHGSIRSPIWKGGGVTFGPLSERNYTQKINKKMNHRAVSVCLSEKVRAGELVVLDALIMSGKTKDVSNMRTSLPGNGKTTLFLLPENHVEFLKASKNVPNCDVKLAINLNVVDLMHHKYIIATPESVRVLEKRLS